MIRIMLACAGGMSTSLLMNKMKEEADNRDWKSVLKRLVKNIGTAFRRI